MHLKVSSITVSFSLGFKYTLIQIGVLYAYSLPIDYHILWNSLCCIVYYMLLINQTIHLGSESHELCDAISVVLVLENGSR